MDLFRSAQTDGRVACERYRTGHKSLKHFERNSIAHARLGTGAIDFLRNDTRGIEAMGFHGSPQNSDERCVNGHGFWPCEISPVSGRNLQILLTEFPLLHSGSSPLRLFCSLEDRLGSKKAHEVEHDAGDGA